VGHTALILGDQLSHRNPALEGADRVLLIESRAALGRLRYHRQRRHLVLSAMRHFAAELRVRDDHEVVERRGVARMADVLGDYAEVRCAEPNSAPSRRALERLGARFVRSSQFLVDPDDFADWAAGRRRVVMEDFYRAQRKRLGVLIGEDGEPEGGRWNFDRDNRRPPRAGLTAPAPWLPAEDDVDAEVRLDLDAMGLPEWGRDAPRAWPATGSEARTALQDFVTHRLAGFGPWQDAMVAGEPWLFHSRLSSSLNLWLLGPGEVVAAVQDAYRAGDVPLQSAEGFVRQLIGWREYVWGMYWLRAGEWRGQNALDAREPLPAAYWGQSPGLDWNCLRSTVDGVAERAYAHHIERLMVLGNIALLAGVRPWEMVEWFQAAFIDGAEWVMAPNTAGMALHADGGAMMTKPYAGGGNYIDRMSDLCAGCRYSPRSRTGPDACPVTALYWDFIARHEQRWAGNPRMALPLRGLQRMDPAELAAVRERAARARAQLAGA